jgi:Cu(I)-responsive transcriptional regulator
VPSTSKITAFGGMRHAKQSAGRVPLGHADAMEQGLMDIGRAARASGVSVKMIRHYEAIGLLPRVARTLANYRVYGPNDVHLLRFIKRARTLGFPMQDIRELVGLWRNRSRSAGAVKRIAGRHVGELKQKIAALQSMVRTLEHLVQHCHGDERPDCPILEDLARVMR